jgi:hypothetical protein
MTDRHCLGLAAAAVLACMLTTGPALAVPSLTSDPAGDTNSAAADIVSSSVTPGARGLELAVQVKDALDPLADPHWGSDSTFISWELDTTGDLGPDFVVEQFLHSGQLVGVVHRASDAEDAQPLCNLVATDFAREAGYRAVVDPACLGFPRSIAYRVRFLYNAGTNVGTDVSPDAGLTAPAPLPEATPPPAAAPSPPPPPGSAPEAIGPAAGGAEVARRATAAPPTPTIRTPAARAPALARTGPGGPRLQLLVAGSVLVVAGLCLIAAQREHGLSGTGGGGGHGH